jgi:hypothetical protein
VEPPDAAALLVPVAGAGEEPDLEPADSVVAFAVASSATFDATASSAAFTIVASSVALTSAAFSTVADAAAEACDIPSLSKGGQP